VSTLQPPESYIAALEMFTNPSRQRLTAQLREQVKTMEVHDIRSVLTAMRMVKTDYELEMIRQAIKETYGLFEAIEQKRSNVQYEHELLAEITSLTVKKQLENAYGPIIASGANALTLHYVKNNAEIDKKSMLLLDIGLKYNGYSADITRTISFAPTKRQQSVYNAVVLVQDYALSILKPGVTMKAYEEDVQQYMGEQLQSLGLINAVSKETVREFYPHATSHFLGIDTHDAADYERPLEPGMVLTVEPGIYIKSEKIGIRLEDDIVITENGNEVLSGALPKYIGSLTI
jgi:Xaa-Pro aminopeptidase